ncbi:N-acyl-D-amino-acid deacylase family protein [Flavivirga spongiicola]|uniref:Amidohydrolase family protein n=1 Tax=Flavivirga spongiicola TaxID=421621 RepID=A0ABU7XTJ1_9FLAO|nr:amidohydrolase family protein [Flavivirga sp. MEBiC05379]MDO5979089.1 amidohydrolase family protein [Flavivirga sp. MEBiC05379]
MTKPIQQPLKKLELLFFLILISCLISCKKEIKADILIQNGTVYNGVDHIPNNLSIAIKEDKIIFIGDESSVSIKASKTIDASKLIVSPGFIDPHTHADRELKDPKTSHNLPFLMQGITTTIVGNDGDSFYPTEKYQKLYNEQGIGTNAVQLIGHHEILKAVVGKSDVEPTRDDIAKMQALMQKEMDAGAFGMSTGLYYAPGSYTNTDEVIALAKIVAKNGGIYDTHLRDESSNTIGLVASVQEAIQIGRQAKLPIHISHIKCLGVDVWHQSDSIIKIVEVAQKEGIEITANQYPYDASGTSLNAAVSPRWAESGGKDSLLYRAALPKFKEQIFKETKVNITRRGGPTKLLVVKCNDTTFLGKTLHQISKILNMPSEEAVYQILETGYVRVASFNMNSHDINNFMKQPWVVTGSDGNTGHPRKYGTFPRKYHKYVKQDGIIDLATFINGSTSKTADIFRIPNRGKLKEGYFADIIIFNPETFKDIANYKDSFQYAEGLEYSIINGKLSVENGEFTKKLNGKVLKK